MNPTTLVYFLSFLLSFLLGAILSPAIQRAYRNTKTLILYTDPRSHESGYAYLKPKSGIATLRIDGDKIPIPLSSTHATKAGRNMAYNVNLALGNVYLPPTDKDAPVNEPDYRVLKEVIYSESERRVTMGRQPGWKEMLASFTPFIAIVTLIIVLVMAAGLYKSGTIH